MNNKITKLSVAAIALCLLVIVWPHAAFASKDDNLIKLQSYRTYLEQHADKKAGNADIVIKADAYTNAEEI